MKNDNFKIDYVSRNLKRLRVSSNIRNYDFLIKLSEKQILKRLNNFSSQLDCILEIGCNTNIAKSFYKEGKSLNFVGVDNSPLILKNNNFIANKVVTNEHDLPFKNNIMSSVISCLYIDHIFNVESLFTNVYKILKKNGLLIFSTFGSKTLANIRECFVKQEEKIYGGVSLRFHPLFDLNLIGDNLKQIGFKNVVVETEIVQVNYNSIFKLMTDLRGMGLTNNLTNRTKCFTSRKLFDEVNEFFTNKSKNKIFSVPFELLTISAWKN